MLIFLSHYCFQKIFLISSCNFHPFVPPVLNSIPRRGRGNRGKKWALSGLGESCEGEGKGALHLRLSHLSHENHPFQPHFQCGGWDSERSYNLDYSSHFYVTIYATICNAICLLHSLCSVLSGTTAPLDRRCWRIKEESNKHWIFCLYCFSQKNRRANSTEIWSCTNIAPDLRGKLQFHSFSISINLNIIFKNKNFPEYIFSFFLLRCMSMTLFYKKIWCLCHFNLANLR